MPRSSLVGESLPSPPRLRAPRASAAGPACQPDGAKPSRAQLHSAVNEHVVSRSYRGGVGVVAQNHLTLQQMSAQMSKTITRSSEMSARSLDCISIACHCRGSSQLPLRQSHNQQRRRINRNRVHVRCSFAHACFLEKEKKLCVLSFRVQTCVQHNARRGRAAVARRTRLVRAGFVARPPALGPDG